MINQSFFSKYALVAICALRLVLYLRNLVFNPIHDSPVSHWLRSSDRCIRIPPRLKLRTLSVLYTIILSEVQYHNVL